MDGFVRVIAFLSRTSGVIAAALIVVSVFVVCQMVVSRYFFGLATTWQTEFVIYALIATTLVGSPYVMLHRGHVNMDIVVLYSGQRTRFVMAVIADTISIVFCGLIFYYGLHFWHEAWANDWHSDTVTRVPLWIPYLSLPLGMGLVTLQLIADLGCLLTGRTRPFGLPPRTGPGIAVMHPEPDDMFQTEREARP